MRSPDLGGTSLATIREGITGCTFLGKDRMGGASDRLLPVKTQIPIKFAVSRG